MTKQEEINWFILNLLVKVARRELDGFTATKQILSYLHSQGVVIKVDRELPELNQDAGKQVRAYIAKLYDYYRICPSILGEEYKALIQTSGIIQLDIERHIYKQAEYNMLQAGYVAVEPLIKGTDD